MANSPHEGVGYEPSDAEPQLISCLALGIGAFLLISPLALLLLFPDSLYGGVFAANMKELPAPRLQTSPQSDLAAFRERENRRLSTYGWLSRDRNTVHMPIERAVELTLERGLPGWPKRWPKP
jgi:hypothetical protein